MVQLREKNKKLTQVLLTPQSNIEQISMDSERYQLYLLSFIMLGTKLFLEDTWEFAFSL